MIRLTYIHWTDKRRGALLLNPRAVMSVVPIERDGETFSQVVIAGYSYTVAETIDEIEALICGKPCTCHPDDKPPRPCPRKYALSDCREAALARTVHHVMRRPFIIECDLCGKVAAQCDCEFER